MLIDRREILRYLGYGKNEPDCGVGELINECIEAVGEHATPRYYYRSFELSWDDGKISAAGMDLTCNSLKRNLAGCREVIFFAATLGNGIDILMNRYQKTDMPRAVILQATAATAIEAYCNEAQREIEALIEKGCFLRPRFSPGYGDLPLDIQGDFLRVLEAYKKVGIALSDGNVMIPEKSVTALMGVSNVDNHCNIGGCESCGMTDCPYKR